MRTRGLVHILTFLKDTSFFFCVVFKFERREAPKALLVKNKSEWKTNVHEQD